MAEHPDGVVVGVDIGGTKTAAATVGIDGSRGPLHTVPTPALDGPGPVLDAAAAAVRSALGDAPLRAVGAGTAGVIDVGTGTVVSSTPTLRDWTGTPVADGLRERLRDRAAGPGPLPVFVENDVDAHAAGETWLGAAAGASSALVVAVGTGVGAAVVLDGRPLRGAHHFAGELGHFPAAGAEALLCPCGRPGHLEAIAAGPAVLRRYLALDGDPAVTDTRGVLARVETDTLATRVVTDAAHATGRAIAGLVTVLDPEVIVLGGGLAGAGEVWWEAVESAMRAELVEALAGVPLRPAALGGDSAVAGAARGAWKIIEEGTT